MERYTMKELHYKHFTLNPLGNVISEWMKTFEYITDDSNKQCMPPNPIYISVPRYRGFVYFMR